jgi:hypothetical protein
MVWPLVRLRIGLDLQTSPRQGRHTFLTPDSSNWCIQDWQQILMDLDTRQDTQGVSRSPSSARDPMSIFLPISTSKQRKLDRHEASKRQVVFVSIDRLGAGVPPSF